MTKGCCVRRSSSRAGGSLRVGIRVVAGLAATLACGLAATAAASGASGPPPPKSPAGKKVTLVAAGGGLAVPTSFAFGDGQVFEGDGGKETSKVPNGGVFVLEDGKARKLAGSLRYVSGLAWHEGALYVAGGTITPGESSATFEIQKWSGWNGTAFASQKTIYTGLKKFQGFDGIAFGPDGRLYAGVALSGTNNNDHGPADTSPYLYSIVTMTDTGAGLKVLATGIRQPWQMAFAPGSDTPFVSDLGQDAPKNLNPPDFVLKVHQGDDYGFPQCTQIVAKACKGFAKPFQEFPPHSDIMGMAIIGNTLYMTSFTGLHPTAKSQAGEVLSMPLSGGTPTPVLTGFAGPTVGLGAHGNTLYVGELTAQVFSVQP
jgi:glucose/arabinose dehydrogenase